MTATSQSKTIRVVLVDDQKMIRQGLGYVIQMQPDMEVIGEASDGNEAIKLVGVLSPDVVLMDVQMPNKSGIDATREIMLLHPSVKVLILTTFDNHNYVVDGIRAGAVGYMLKDADSQEMLDLIRRAYQGEALFHTVTAAKALAEALQAQRTAVPDSSSTPPVLLDDLTERELDVLQQIAYGYRNDQIAQNLFISEGTVKTHVHRILQKMGVEDRTQAVAKALRHQLVK
ncbi:putative transcriptional regulatory protein YxjL [Brevibacillus reuszeri]|uniref:LuxR family transcriptional regulator n=1 Tax=Brevibacillus reuszeri TaxID=54915 RepID=A0A0K9YNN1_9BACL|nr:response regulator transcription factor [Brevibacillus reuszeri]KNB70281.1 LuxR family transcriptional regulator [Brevibacillus reuszeri]MED1859241.1 response regulator transcription factor [Brevibacillus reuszeri]GED72263.1 putative transcriptional regulatory protein YxjL [Brevibacillus reuszeri]